MYLCLLFFVKVSISFLAVKSSSLLLWWNEGGTPRCFLDVLFFLPDLSESCIMIKTDQTNESLFLHCVLDLKFKSGKKKLKILFPYFWLVWSSFCIWLFKLLRIQFHMTNLVYQVLIYAFLCSHDIMIERGGSEYEQGYVNTFNKNWIFV